MIPFLAIDVVGISLIVLPVFREHAPDLLSQSPRLGAAAVFYLGYIAGLIWLVSLPALRDRQPRQALLRGAVLGLLAYGTYEFTNFATIDVWEWPMVIVDTLWGGVLTGTSAWIGVLTARRFF